MTVRTRAQLNSDADTNLPDNTVGSITPAKLRAIAKNMADSAKLAEDSSDTLTEGTTNLFFTAARVRAAVLTGLSTATNAVISATDSVLSGMGKLQKQITDLSSSAAPIASPTFTGPVTLAQDPAAALQAATKQYVDNLALNVGKRGTVRVATTANIVISTALNAADVLDGVTLASGDLVLVKNQTAPAENGVYVVGATPARSTEFDTYNEHPGALIAVKEGTVAADTLWLCTSNDGGTLNTTAIAFSAVALSLLDDSVTNAKLANMTNATIKGRATASTGDPEDLTLTQVLDMVGSAAQGDILYRGSAAWQRLAAGTGLQSLRMNAAGTAPEWGTSLPVANLLINGSGAINQRGVVTPSDDIYAWDRHYVLTQTAAIGVSTLSNVANALSSMMRMTQSQAAAQRMGVAQIIEGKNCRNLRGQAVTLLGKLRCSAAQAIRYAILEWTGTEDAVVSDVVNSWTNGTFTAGQFFNSTTLTVNQVGTITPAAATVTDFLLTATLGNSLNNLIVLMWTEGTAAQNVTLDVAWELLPGNLTGQTYPQSPPRPFGQELALCQRYYQKTCPTATAPADGVLTGCIVVVPQAVTGFLAYHWRFQTSMRATPTVTTYNTWAGGTPGYWGNAAASASSQPLVTNAGTDACVIYLNNAASQAWTSQGWQITATLDAEL